MHIYLNGRIIREDEATLSINDRGFLLGDGVFETIRAYNGKPFLLNAHIKRLFIGLGRLSIKIKEKEDDISGIIRRLIELNGLKDAYIRITVSRGLCQRGIGTKDCSEPTVCINVKSFSPPDDTLYTEGVSVCFVKRKNLRLPEDSSIKHLSFLNYVLARLEVEEKGTFEGIMLNSAGHITECTTSNIFFVKENRIFTPSINTGILAGITRQVVIDLIRESNYELIEGEFFKNELFEAQEVFITNSLIELMPVSRVDDKELSSHSVTSRLLRLYRELISTECF